MFVKPSLNEVLLHTPDSQEWLYFHHPEHVLTAYRTEDLPDLLSEIEREVNLRNRFAAGFLSYDAAPAFDPALQVKSTVQENLPLSWFGIYRELSRLPSAAVASKCDQDANIFFGPWQPDVTELSYRRAIQNIKEKISHGETYQVNFTYRLHASCYKPAWTVFAGLAVAHAAPYAAFLETEAWALCSISPELFFTLNGNTLTSRPMKGTASRGNTLEDDLRQARWLHHSGKNQAENIMIVDMVRNDLGRIARIGSICVPEIFQVEKYPTVWQMTSTIQGETKAGLSEILRALFPAASITGAPKVRTMQIISNLESSSRGAYTGAIGYYGPQRQAQFNVAIRTLFYNKLGKEVEYGVGGGIVFDSVPEDEWEETITKSRILHESSRHFDLLETMRWTPEEGWFLLAQHLDRLKKSAAYFSYPFETSAIHESLSRSEAGFNGIARMVRLMLSRDGQVSIQSQPLLQRTNPSRVCIARSPTNSSNRFLYHKTTRRELYQKALAECPGYDEVLLWNERGEITEACTANLVADLYGELVTPPVESGLLAGTYRAWLLKSGKMVERTILVQELTKCSRLFLVNSVRGMWKIKVDLL